MSCSRPQRRLLALCGLLFGLACLGAPGAWARPGGGSSFRSSSSSRSSSSHSSSRSSSGSSSSYHGSGGSSGGDVDLDPATIAAILSAFVGVVIAVPGCLGLAMIMVQGAARGRKREGSAAGFIFGLVLTSVSVLLTMRAVHKDGVMAIVSLLVLGVFGAGRLIGMFSAAPIAASAPVATRPPRNVDRALRALRERDAGFSRVSFLDWVQALYHGLHGWLGTPAEKNLAPFIAEDLMTALHREAGPGATLTSIVIGSMTITEVDLDAETAAIVVELEANYTLERKGTAPVRLVLAEAWRLERAMTAVTPPPARMRVLSCPSCGAALSINDLGACTYCNAALRGGQLQWQVTRRAVLSSEQFSTDGLGETVPEEGTELETRFDRSVTDDANELALAHGLPDASTFADQLRTTVVEPVFQQMYAAWSNHKWNDARHLLTDRLWESQRSWVVAYMHKGLTNKLDDLRVDDVQLVRAERDRDYEAATVRVYASCRDYTVNGAGKIIGGDARRPRRFSEYWVFIRSSTAKEPKVPRAEAKCPNCGAPLDQLGETGVCGYCQAKVTTGDFGWVLSAIVQDEVYRG